MLTFIRMKESEPLALGFPDRQTALDFDLKEGVPRVSGGAVGIYCVLHFLGCALRPQ